ncbi:hypothetical protein DOTSEDRAFT_68945 [Dothistroma septosporum NZE10]|uniref:Mediator of RNA polymerase II transcription subunit 31 n=1 Tax=Dothistroma septosporum (strain NZE10 / CBS 128990) TaxID=675120 RepID=N1Q4H2_DOTSN|nr:hypothetical protein DOTSEDRAFT_68945 [Dothistroma septosporum NZE10]
MAEPANRQAPSEAIAAPPANIQYGGEDRFVLELEFVQMLANPHYLNHLATQKLLDSEEFIAYLDYLQYFRQPKYLRYLQFPAPTLRALELLQEESFRKAILVPAVVEQMMNEGFDAALNAS